MGSPSMIGYRERIQKHAGAAGFFVPDDYQLLLGWIEAYDLQTQPEKLAGRPLLFWHGTEDEKIPYADVETFVQGNPEANLTFISREERHLVRGETMDQVTAFFVEQLGKSTDSL